jgi:general secretion pathway protein D
MIAPRHGRLRRLVRGTGAIPASALAACAAVWLGVVAAPCALAAVDESGFVEFSFDRIEVQSLAKIVSDRTGRQIVVDDGVRTKITVISPRIPAKDMYSLFVSVLESAGCGVVSDGKVSRIVMLPARATVSAPVIGPAEAIPSEGVVTKVFRLQHVQASQLRRVLEGRISGGRAAGLSDVDDTNHLVVTDTAESIRRVEKLIGEIDQPGLAQATEVVALKFTAAEPLAEQLTQALADRSTRGERMARRLPTPPDGTASDRMVPTIVPVPDANSLILVGSSSQIQELKRIISLMDVEAAAGRGRFNAIFLKHLSAADAAKQMDALVNRTGRQTPGVMATGKGGITIEASPTSNALLVHATPGDFENIRKLVEQLDVPREQVHIEVVIAEVSAGEDLNFGVELASVDMPAGVGLNTVQGASRLSDGAESVMSTIQSGLFPRGLTVGVAHGTRLDGSGNVTVGYPALINIDAARRNTNFKVLSHTALETQDNQEASVNIVNQIPILKSTVQGTGATRDVIQNIDRVDVGIKLKLTPHVIPGRLVQMVLNPSIEAVIDPGPSGTTFAPTIARRDVTTTVTVHDGRTIIIAGLTREDKTVIEKRVPLLGSIPLLGWLFRSKVDSEEKTNVLIFVTPKLLPDAAAAGSVIQDWKQKTGISPDEKR